MTTINMMPFDILCEVFKYLELADWCSLSQMGPLFDEAAQWVACRKRPAVVMDLLDFPRIDLLRPSCRFLATFVRTLTIDFNPSYILNRESTKIIAQMIDSAPNLVDLTLCNAITDANLITPTLLSRIQRLELYAVSDDDQFVYNLLITCSRDTLTELVIQDMHVTGMCLRAIKGQLEYFSLSELYFFDIRHLYEMAKRYPQLLSLELGTDYEIPVSLLQLTQYLPKLRDLKLHSAVITDVEALGEHDQLRTLAITFEGSLLDFTDMVHSVGPQNMLRHLQIDAENVVFCKRMGLDMCRYRRLKSLDMNLTDTLGVERLLRGIGKHPRLRTLRLGGTDLHEVVRPVVLRNTLTHIVHLNVRLYASAELLLIAEMHRLRTLVLQLIWNPLLAVHEQTAAIDRLIWGMAAANTLHAVRIDVPSDLKPLVLRPKTIAILPQFTSLRELMLAAKCPFASVKGLLGAMPQLEVFENRSCDKSVYSKKAELWAMRPDMRCLVFDLTPEHML